MIGTENTHLGNEGSKDQETTENDTLLIDDIELLGDGGGEETSTENDRTSLGDKVGRGRELVDKFGRTLRWGLLAVGGHSPAVSTIIESMFNR